MPLKTPAKIRPIKSRRLFFFEGCFEGFASGVGQSGEICSAIRVSCYISHESSRLRARCAFWPTIERKICSSVV